jgi:hypothetical protein
MSGVIDLHASKGGQVHISVLSITTFHVRGEGFNLLTYRTMVRLLSYQDEIARVICATDILWMDVLHPLSSERADYGAAAGLMGRSTAVTG